MPRLERTAQLSGWADSDVLRFNERLPIVGARVHILGIIAALPKIIGPSQTERAKLLG